MLLIISCTKTSLVKCVFTWFSVYLFSAQMELEYLFLVLSFFHVLADW